MKVYPTTLILYTLVVQKGKQDLKKIVDLSNFNREIINHQKKIVLVGGCFDIFHFGHLVFLEKAKETGDFLIVALESDNFIRLKKKREPVHNQNQRARILAALEVVDLVITLPFFSSDRQYDNLVLMIRPSVIAVSSGDPQLENKMRQASRVGAKVEVVSSILDSYSTKSIIIRLKSLI